MEKNAVGMIATIIVLIGGLNWAATGFNYNVLRMIFGSIPALETVVYIIVALASIYVTYEYFSM